MLEAVKWYKDQVLNSKGMKPQRIILMGDTNLEGQIMVQVDDYLVNDLLENASGTNAKLDARLDRILILTLQAPDPNYNGVPVRII